MAKVPPCRRFLLMIHGFIIHALEIIPALTCINEREMIAA